MVSFNPPETKVGCICPIRKVRHKVCDSCIKPLHKHFWGSGEDEETLGI